MNIPKYEGFNASQSFIMEAKIQGAREVSNHIWDNANFCFFILCNLKDVGHRTTNKRPKLETQWTAFC